MQLFKRENYLQKIRGFYHADDIIKVITGVRRCGKSSLMQTIAQELMDQGISKEQIITIDLDKRGFKNIKTADALETCILSYNTTPKKKYLFIDEIQNVTGFEVVINAFRNEGDWSIFITGSNSYLLSGELVTKLTGRYLEFELFPLSFDEYVAMKQFYHLPLLPTNNQELNQYIKEGGFPRTIFLTNPDDKRRYMEGIIDEIFTKDIQRRVKIKDREAFQIVRDYIIHNFGATTSIANITKALNQSGTTITRSTVAKYIQVLVDAKILYVASRFDLKSKRALQGEKKYYVVDLGFYYARSTDNRIHYGPTLENIVYLYARAHDYAISVGRIGKFECDFILRKHEQYAYLQIAYTIALSQETEDREYRPLEQIRDNYPKYVATTDTLLQQRNGIQHINIADFMKEGKSF